MKRLYEWLDDWDVAISDGVKKHQDSTIHLLAYWEIMKHLEKVRSAVDDDDIEKAVLWTAQLAHKLHSFENLIQLPQIKTDAARTGRSAAAKNAANARWGQPEWKQEAIQKEMDLVKTDLGPSAPKTAIFKELSKRCFNGDGSKYKRFERMASNGLLKI